MKIQEHIDKITWSFADKVIYILYGFVTLFQINLIEPGEFGLFALLINFNIWIFIISDSFALQGLIQFGMNKDSIGRVNLYILIIHTSIVMLISLAIFFLRFKLSIFFNEPGLIKVGGVLPILCLLTLPRMYALKLLYRDQNLNRVFWSDMMHFGVMTILTIYYYFLIRQLSFDEMVIIYLGGTVAGDFLILWLAREKLIINLKGDFAIGQLFRFGFPLMFQSAFHAMPRLLDVYFVQYFFGTTSVGIYSSAKTLYRVFDEAAHATYGLLYPTAVRQHRYGNVEELKSLITKSISFMLVCFLGLVLLLELGLSNFIISNFLPFKYHLAIPVFNLMILASIGLPFVMSSLIINAEGYPRKVLIFTSSSAIISFIGYYLLGINGNLNLVPAGLIIYNFAFGLMNYIYLKRKYKLPLSSLFRAFGDVTNYLKKIAAK